MRTTRCAGNGADPRAALILHKANPPRLPRTLPRAVLILHKADQPGRGHRGTVEIPLENAAVQREQQVPKLPALHILRHHPEA